MQLHKKLTLTLIVSLFMVTTVYAQQNTPSPAPSKTPQTTTVTPAATIVQSTADPNTLKPFIQTDLTIITANTQRPNGIVWHDNNLYTVCTGDWTVYEIDAETGETEQYIYGIRNAHTLYASTENNEFNLWIPDFQSNSLIRINRGTTETITTALNGPWGITPINETEFAITNLKDNNVMLVSRAGETREIINNLRSPTGIAADNTHLYVANTGSARRAIEWFSISDFTNDENTTPIETNGEDNVLISGLQNTTGITLGPDGLLYFAYALGTRGIVGRVDPKQCIENGGCTNDQIEVVIFTELPVPLAGLTISTDMRLYIHSMFSPDLYWVQLPSP
ncbi:MAG: hypothetical protein HXY41_12425 [Chloroflexi bacterium]|nr:hypothetical protein [Chloroflexota bacterium]